MLRLLTFVDIIFRSSIKTGLLLWSLSRSPLGEERGKEGMKSWTVQDYHLVTELQLCRRFAYISDKFLVLEKQTLQPLYNNRPLKEGLYITSGL